VLGVRTNEQATKTYRQESKQIVAKLFPSRPTAEAGNPAAHLELRMWT